MTKWFEQLANAAGWWRIAKLCGLWRDLRNRDVPGYCTTCGGNTITGPYCGQC